MGYQIPVLQQYVSFYNSEVHVVHWDKRKLTPYKPPVIAGVNFYNRSNFNNSSLLALAIKINPDVVYVSGWMDKEYLHVCKYLKEQKVPVVAGSDTQWKADIKHVLGSIYFKVLMKKYFTRIWVAGPYQYEYARRLGFKNHEIIFNCYSADIDLFNKAFNESNRREKYPHKFLYVGRFENAKGLDILVQAWEHLKNERKDWELVIIGNGSLKSFLNKQKDITIKEFMQPAELINEIETAGCFILPSRYEPWALVLHEFSAAGLPIICSDVCGAAPVFVIQNYNGYTFTSQNVNSLIEQMKRIINSSDEKLLDMSNKSHQLGQKINPEIVAASFLSALKK